MDNRVKVLDILKNTRLGVISTIHSNNTPESAVVAVTETQNLEIVFATLDITRKYKNILSNTNVSFVIGWDNWITVQIEGVANITKGEEREKCQALHLTKHPDSKRYAADPHEQYIKVTPKWIRYTDFNKTPEEIFEITP